MEVELGLKLTRVADEFTSDFQIAKDRSGIVFMSRETDTMFILTAHLKGYRRGNIKIDINEDGTLIAISGEKQVKETVMVGWKVYKKDREIKGFKKVFRIPDGVNLDKILAKFNEDESTLTVTMPKKVKGILGISIEEIKERPELVREGSGSLPIGDEKIQTTADTGEKSEARIGEDDTDDQMPSADVQDDHDLRAKQDEVHEKDPKVENQETVKDKQDITEPQQDRNQLPKQDQKENDDQVTDKANDIHDEDKHDEEEEGHVESPEEAREAEPGREHDGEHKPWGKRCKMCIPIVAGSTLLLSFVVFVIQIMRRKNQTSRKKD